MCSLSACHNFGCWFFYQIILWPQLVVVLMMENLENIRIALFHINVSWLIKVTVTRKWYKLSYTFLEEMISSQGVKKERAKYRKEQNIIGYHLMSLIFLNSYLFFLIHAYFFDSYLFFLIHGYFSLSDIFWVCFFFSSTTF